MNDDGWQAQEVIAGSANGRWPANTVITHSPDCEQECVEGCPVLELDGQSGVSKSAGGRIGKKAQSSVTNVPAGQFEAGDPGYGDTGGASRYFTQTTYTEADYPAFLYYAKASKRERNAGLEGLEAKGKVFNGQSDTPAGNAPGSVEDKFSTKPQQNHHPTVKPVALMRHLIKLITPAGGTVLDPFLGSGTTAVAAVLEGFSWVGCELTEDYWPIIEGRVAWAMNHAVMVSSKAVLVSGAVTPDAPAEPPSEELTLF